MRNAWIFGLALVLLSFPVAAQNEDFSKVELKVTKVSGSIYMLQGSGGQHCRLGGRGRHSDCGR